MNKSKAPLALMEQLIMLLVFALAAALCLQVFVLSGQLSRRCEMRAHAATEVQNVAEALKICKGNMDDGKLLVGGTSAGEGWKIAYDSEWKESPSGNADYQILIKPLKEGSLPLGSAEISAQTADGELLFQVTVSWQEESYG